MNNKKAVILWFTGLSGSGKTTIAESLKNYMVLMGLKVLILDGDNIRGTINKELNFTEKDIKINNLMVASLVVQYQEKFDLIIVPIISPYRDHRSIVKEVITSNFYEIYIKCSLAECIRRDVKGLYQKTIIGEINNMIGVSPSNPYEEPINPNLTVNTQSQTLQKSLNKIISFLNDKF